ncbi:MAG: GNAT family N-acetyltransferase [Methylothermaceae bacterium]|nr:GNAT family N-acetyltransferase [Methylothermaceae bacterium]
MQRDFSVASNRRYEAFVAMNDATVREAYALRYRVFAQEMGARLEGSDGLDRDQFDPYCDHLVVRDRQSGKIVGCTRLLSDAAADRVGHFYSEKEFDLGAVRTLPGRFLEVGRTCVDRTSRGGIVLTILWSALIHYARERGFSYLMGCASIPPGPDGFAVEAFYSRLTPEQTGPNWLEVTSRCPVPPDLHCVRDDCGVPPLLQTYLRVGAWVCGDPYWDEDFNCMDVFILLPLANIQSRYSKHFLETRTKDRGRVESLS